jgi:hypothetical protein
VIQIYQDISGSTPTEGTQTPAPSPTSMAVGNQISVVTGIILDHNGNQVPDGTIVQFSLYHNGESVPSQIVESQTSQGVARGNLLIDQSGEINIRAESGQAVTSDVLTFEIPPEPGSSTPFSPTQTPTHTPTGTASPTLTPTSTPQATAIPVNISSTGGVDFGDWLIALIVIALISVANYWLINQRSGLRWGVRAALLPLIGGLFTYIYLAINMPGSQPMLTEMGIWGVILLVIIGALIGVGAIWIWQRIDLQNSKPVKN